MTCAQDNDSADGVRILILGSAHSIALEQWVVSMQERGHVVRIMSPYEPREALREITEDSEPGVKVPGVQAMMRRARIKRAIAEFRPDVVHGHGAYNYGLWAVESGFSPTLVTCWGSDVLLAPHSSDRAHSKVRRALRGADYVTAASEAVFDAAQDVAATPLPGEVIPWGVDLEVFRPSERSDDGIVRIVSVRSHTPVYNIDVILRALRLVLEWGVRAKLIVAGSGTETAALRELAGSLGIDGDVEFTGWMSQADLAKLYQGSDIYVSVPSSDGSAVSNMEAMASGLPLIVSDLPSAHEWVRGGTDGLFVPVGGTDDLAAAMLELAQNPELRATMGRAARERIESIGDREVLMGRADEVYRALAKGLRP